MTIHGAKGLEFPITVLAGTTTRFQRPTGGPSVDFPPDGSALIKLSSAVASHGYDAWKPIEDQMDEHERLRLMYVAATRARDHLVVCLHRLEGKARTSASVLAAPALESSASTPFVPSPSPAPIPRAPPRAELPERPHSAPERNEALAKASIRTVVAATTLASEAAEANDPGLHKRSRDLDLPPWQKGRYGTAVGRAVHGVLQVVDLATGAGLDDAASAQAAAEGVANRTEVIRRLAASAIESPIAEAAARAEHWRELWVAAPVGGRLIEGYVDLLYRSSDGLVVVGWKTDQVEGDNDLAAKLARYRLQGAAYAAAVEAATDEPVSRMVFVFLSEVGALEEDLVDLRAAITEVGARAPELAELSATADIFAEI